MRISTLHGTSAAALALLGLVACSSSDASSAPSGTNGVSTDTNNSGSSTTPEDESIPVFDDIDPLPSGSSDAPKTCAEAAQARIYVGCEFWPTIVANPVYTEFDPAIVLANANEADATISVTGPNGFTAEAVVPAGGLETVILAWIPELKGPEYSRMNTSGGRLESSVRVDQGAYKVTSSLPVTAWQFNPLQYEKPGLRSASNDASLLLPVNAMTGNYRVFAFSSKNTGKSWGTVPGGFAITATQDATEVLVQLGPQCGTAPNDPTTQPLGVCVSPGTGVEAGNAGDVYTFAMNAGDVIQLVGAWSGNEPLNNADVSGSVVNANKPVQVIAFNAIAELPDRVSNADHIEETVLPAEVLGQRYIVVPPTTPNGDTVGHVVRIYGSVDNTTLTYPGERPSGAPDVINAGDVVQIPADIPISCSMPSCVFNTPFIVEGDQPFAVNSFMVAGTIQMPGTNESTSRGDPAMSQMVSPEQFRQEYTFLAPSDYTENFAEVLAPAGAEVVLDGAAVAAPFEPIGTSGWTFARVPLAGANGGVHKISTTHESGLGLQVSGFGYATSYYYPGGLNLKLISMPPTIR